MEGWSWSGSVSCPAMDHGMVLAGASVAGVAGVTAGVVWLPRRLVLVSAAAVGMLAAGGAAVGLMAAGWWWLVAALIVVALGVVGARRRGVASDVVVAGGIVTSWRGGRLSGSCGRCCSSCDMAIARQCSAGRHEGLRRQVGLYVCRHEPWSVNRGVTGGAGESLLVGGDVDRAVAGRVLAEIRRGYWWTTRTGISAAAALFVSSACPNSVLPVEVAVTTPVDVM